MLLNLDSILLIIELARDKNSQNKKNLVNLKNRLSITIYVKNIIYKKILFRLAVEVREYFTARISFRQLDILINY